MPDSYRPTLYDFVAHQALEFYNSGEQAAAKAEDAFELSADSPIFRPVEEFVAWKSSRRSDSDSTTLKAIRLYQQLLRFHQDDEDKSALLDADIERLSFGNNKAVGEEKAALYKAGLAAFREAMGRPPHLGHRPLPPGPASCSRKARWSRPTTWPSRAPRPLPTRPAATSATTS